MPRAGGRQSVRQWKWRRRPAQCRKLSLFWIAFNFTEQPPQKTIQKSKTWRGRKTRKKKRKKREVLQTSVHRYLQRIVFRCWLSFFCVRELQERESPPKHKVEREKCEATGLCVSTRLPDSLLIHAVQCNGTWTWIIIAFKCCDNGDDTICDIYLFFLVGYCPVLATIWEMWRSGLT